MAAEEPEYFSVTAGNGLAPITRPQKGGAAKKAKPTAGAQTQKGGFTSFLQGITVGTVLLIPVGVWCWVRPGGGEEIIQSDVKETAPASKTAGKSNKRPVAGVKRKPVKTGSGASLPPATIDMGGRPRLVVESDPPPAAVAAPTAAATSASQLVAKPAAQVSEEFDEPQKPKKGIWRTLFHRK